MGWRDQHFEALGLAYTERHCFDWHQIADQEPWTLAPAALLEAALDPATPVARAIVDAACALYETDFACFANANAHARSPGCAALVRARLAAVRR